MIKYFLKVLFSNVKPYLISFKNSFFWLALLGTLVLFGWSAIIPLEVSAVTLTYTASTTWTVPAGVTNVKVEVWGGGGGGGGQNLKTDGGGGGGGGAYSRRNSTSTIPGAVYTVSIGVNGVGGTGGCGTAGGDSWFANSTAILAKGGQMGCDSTGAPPEGGLGGAAGSGIGDIKFSGGQGEAGRDSSAGSGGYGGSSAGIAVDGWSGPQTWSITTYPTPSTPEGGGHGGDGGALNVNGSAPASGNGGGGGGSGEGQPQTGGNGAVGKIVLTYSSSTVITSGTQKSNLDIPSEGQYIEGAFIILPDTSSTITRITITENGTVDANTGLDNILLRYDLDAVDPYDCADQSYSSGDNQYGSTDTDGFSSANGTSTFIGAVLASSTQAMCVYVELDVTAGASGNLEIRIATSSDVVTGGYVAGTFPLDIPGTTSLDIPQAVISCSTNIGSTNFEPLTDSSIFTSSPNTSTTMSCSGTSSGCTLYIKDVGNTSSPGLYKSASPTYLVVSADSTLSIGVDGYGIQATSTATGSGGLLSFNSKYNKTGNNVGGFTLTNTVLASSTADVTNREVIVMHKAAVSNQAISGSYSDMITYECVAN
ncbi:MAG: hypothetical protein ABIH10_01215 [Spirochaetota bacterium]